MDHSGWQSVKPEENNMKNYISVMCVVIVLSIMHWSSSASAQPTKVAIGYSGISADQLVIWVAKDAGILPKTTSMRKPSISQAARLRLQR